MNKYHILSFLALIAGSCGGDSSAPGIEAAAKVAVVSGTPQNAEAGQTLAAPLVVQVTDASNQPVSKVLVSFTIKSGGGNQPNTRHHGRFR